MNRHGENATVPREHKRRSHEETRAVLLEAIARLRNGNPQRVDQGTPITVSSVAREAGVHRTLLHNHHGDIVTQIHALKNQGTDPQLHPQDAELAEARQENKVLRNLIEQLQEDKTRLAQHNYALRHENEGLKAQLTRKSQMLREFTRTENATDRVDAGEIGQGGRSEKHGDAP
jgi:AcrR family transcriptional regulator